MIKYPLILIIAMGLLSCASKQKFETVRNVDIQKHTGVWHEIARLPNSFEKGLECITAKYTLLENVRIEVINKKYLTDNKNEYKDVRDIAKIPFPHKKGVYKVSFFIPIWGYCNIITLDRNCQYALPGSPSRTKNPDKKAYNELLETTNMHEFDSDTIIHVKHDCD